MSRACVGRDSRQGETGNSRTMVRAGIAASACKPMRALQAYPAEMVHGFAAGCGFAFPTLRCTLMQASRMNQRLLRP